MMNKIFKNNEHFDEMMNIINEARLNPPKEGHRHHIIPRCWFKKKNLEIDNSVENLVLLSYEDHVKVHELLYHCCKSKIMKRNMAYAYQILSKGEMVENGCFKGENHPNFGKKGKKRSDETRKKMSKSHKGKVLSDETREKISESLKGRTRSDEHRENLSESLKGRTLSAETRKKMSEAHKGKSWKLVDGKRIWYKKEFTQ